MELIQSQISSRSLLEEEWVAFDALASERKGRESGIREIARNMLKLKIRRTGS